MLDAGCIFIIILKGIIIIHIKKNCEITKLHHLWHEQLINRINNSCIQQPSLPNLTVHFFLHTFDTHFFMIFWYHQCLQRPLLIHFLMCKMLFRFVLLLFLLRERSSEVWKSLFLFFFYHSSQIFLFHWFGLYFWT